MSRNRKLIIIGLIIAVLITAVITLKVSRIDSLVEALRPLQTTANLEHAQVATAILENYREVRGNAAMWSGVYWGFTFFATILSALAAIILKVESLFAGREPLKRDLAAVFSICAALLITISTSGEFQRKWQANRLAASELERLGYDLLQSRDADVRSYYANLGTILHNRNLTIIGEQSPKGP